MSAQLGKFTLYKQGRYVFINCNDVVVIEEAPHGPFGEQHAIIVIRNGTGYDVYGRATEIAKILSNAQPAKEAEVEAGGE